MTTQKKTISLLDQKQLHYILVELLLTLSLYEDPEQWVGRGHRRAEVVVVVDWQQVSVDVSVANHDLHVGDAVNVHDELIEVLELPRFEPVHGEPPELCSVLQGQHIGVS